MNTTSDQVTFPPPVVAAMQAQLPAVAQQTVASIVVEVPSYADAFSGEMGRAISNAVQLALGGFLELATTAGGVDASRPIGPALEGAYSLGRGEARSPSRPSGGREAAARPRPPHFSRACPFLL